MLSINESNGLRDILLALEDEELFRLLGTVTKRMFTSNMCNRSEAVETILACTKKPSDLLGRQKITKKILFNYLIKKENVLPEWGKITLVQKCLEHWQSVESVTESDFTGGENEEKPTNDLQPVTSQMAIEFSKWFFSILNTLKDFGPEHFWPNCNLGAELYSPTEQKEISLTGASDVAAFLTNLIVLDKYKFGAHNSSDSVRVDMEEHGLVKIIVSGVLYQNSNCVGIFDFAFGLVKNPDSDYNYKIQVVKIKMQVNCGAQGALPANNQLPLHQSAIKSM